MMDARVGGCPKSTSAGIAPAEIRMFCSGAVPRRDSDSYYGVHVIRLVRSNGVVVTPRVHAAPRSSARPVPRERWSEFKVAMGCARVVRSL
jgi:hypothetical protein